MSCHQHNSAAAPSTPPHTLVGKDELFPQEPIHPVYRIGAYTFGGERHLFRSRIRHQPDHQWLLGLGTDVTFYSKPSVLNASYGVHPVSFQIFLRMRPAQSEQRHR